MQPDDLKLAKTQHKENLDALDSALKVITHVLAPRLSQLGVDADGREYWACSAAPWERDLAFDLIETKSSEAPENVKSTRPKKMMFEEGDGERCTDWSWFVAVWGELPGDGHVAGSGDDKFEGKKWWAFWDPKEIEKLSKWLHIRSSSASDNEEESQPKRPLVKALEDYASDLTWRIQSATIS